MLTALPTLPLELVLRGVSCADRGGLKACSKDLHAKATRLESTDR